MGWRGWCQSIGNLFWCRSGKSETERKTDTEREAALKGVRWNKNTEVDKGRISCVWSGDPVRSLCLFGDETGFPLLAFPWSKERGKSTERLWILVILGWIIRKKKKPCSLSSDRNQFLRSE
ncbi:hypothetical protein AMECASPLE_004426 [Ameca splendens]|uniref:Uncharacterized protein n=1 Tax=Ameca splendens TaxID=208324 RepID=A0ABV0YA64_9TELE